MMSDRWQPIGPKCPYSEREFFDALFDDGTIFFTVLPDEIQWGLETVKYGKFTHHRRSDPQPDRYEWEDR